MIAETAEGAAQPDAVNSPAATTHYARQCRRGRYVSRGPRTPGQDDTNPAHDVPRVSDLVISARNGDKRAWDALVERYAPLIWSICRRHHLGSADVEDVGQIVWLNLVEHLDDLRDSAALPGWLATTARRECCRVLRASRLTTGAGGLDDLQDERIATAEHELLVAERNAALHEAFARLPLHCQRLLALLIADPPVAYTEISARLGIAVGSIGPNRHRYLDKLRRDPVIAGLLIAEAANGK